MKYNKMILLFTLVLTLLYAHTAHAQQSGHTPASGSVEVSCPKEGGIFRLEAENGSPDAETDTIRIEGKGKGRFVCRFSEPGDYVYTLEQVQMDRKDLDYDAGKYRVLFQVTTDDAGVLSAGTQVLKKDSDIKCSEASFVNTLQTEKSSSDSAKMDSTSPKTGDRMMFTACYTAVVMAAALVLLWAAIRKRGRKRE